MPAYPAKSFGTVGGGGASAVHVGRSSVVQGATATTAFEIAGPNPNRRFAGVVNHGQGGDILYVFMQDNKPGASELGYPVLPFNVWEAPIVGDCPPTPYNGRLWGRWATALSSTATFFEVN